MWCTSCEKSFGTISIHKVCTFFIKKHIFGTWKFKKIKNYAWNLEIYVGYCYSCLHVSICQKWASYHDLRHRNGHCLGHLAWNPILMRRDRTYCEASLLKSCQNSSFSVIMETSVCLATPCTSFPNFINFHYFPWIFSKLGQICLHENSYLED